MRPTVREVSKQYKGKVKLVINMYTAQGEQRAIALKAAGHPVLLFHDQNGKEVLRRYGVVRKDRVQQGFALLAAAH